MPKFPRAAEEEEGEEAGEDEMEEDPRAFLIREEETHRRECLSREAGWEAEVLEALSAADVVRVFG